MNPIIITFVFQVNLKKIITARRKRKLSQKQSKSCTFSSDKIEAMKKKAKELSEKIAQKSKLINEPTQSEMYSKSEYCLNTDESLQKSSELVRDNDQLSSSVNNQKTSDLSGTSSSFENILPATTAPSTSNYLTSSKKSKHSRTKLIKPEIPFLVKCDVYQDEHVDNSTSKKQDDYVLEKLFNKSGKLY